MASGSSDLVRSVALDRFIKPAKAAGKRHFTIAVRDLMENLQSTGFPRNNYPQICTSLQKQRFLQENSLQIDHIEGPPSGQSPTVVIHYRIAGENHDSVESTSSGAEEAESPRERARKLAHKLRGLLREELAEYGGGEAFLRWIRSEDDEMPSRTPEPSKP